MRKKFLCILILVSVIMFGLQGCSNPKSEADIFSDLQNSGEFTLCDGMEAESYHIIKRQTDKQNKSDRVYIQVDVENENVAQSRAYIMDYTLYNDGWMLDAVEEYWDGDHWLVRAKREPDDDTVIKALAAWSDRQLQDYYNSMYIPSELTGPMFFEEGKYRYTISPESLEDNTYTCMISVVRPFKYVSSHEEIRASLSIDPYTCTWEVISAESTSLTAEWFMAHIWSSGDEVVYFNSLDIGKYAVILSDTRTYGYDIPDAALEFVVPSFNQISPAMTIMEYDGIRGDVYGEIILWPDRMWAIDRDGESVELVGEIEYVYAQLEDAEKYTEVAKRTIEALWKDADIDAIIELLHPSTQNDIISEYEVALSYDWPTFFNVDASQELVTYNMGEAKIYNDASRFDPDGQFYYGIISNLREENYRVDAIGAIEYELIYQDNTINCWILLVESDEQLYVWSIR